MPRILIALFAFLLATPARAEEPAEPKLGEGYIAWKCAMQFPSDPAASKACEVTIQVLLDRKVDDRIIGLEMSIDVLFAVLEKRDVRIAELEAKIAQLETTKKDKRR